MIVEILVAQRQGIHPLPHQRAELMLDAPSIAMIGEAPGQSLDDARVSLHLAQQQAAAIGTYPPTIKTRPYTPSSQGVKFHLLIATLCRHKAAPSLNHNRLITQTLCHDLRPFSISLVKYPG